MADDYRYRPYPGMLPPGIPGAGDVYPSDEETARQMAHGRVDYQYGEYPGPPPPFAGGQGLDDQEQFDLLGPRAGDENPRLHNAGYPWGKVVKLTADRPQVTAVNTPIYPNARPFAYQVRFSLNAEGPFVPVLDAGYAGTVLLNMIKSIDLKTGSVTEQQLFTPGGPPQQACTVIARSLSIAVQAVPDTATDVIYCEVVACPVETIDCGDLTGQANGYANAQNDGFFDAATTVTPVTGDIAPNPVRRQVFIQNTSNQDLYILFSANPVAVPSATLFSIKLPGGINAIYESPPGGYTGRILLTYLVAGTGGASVTEGTP